MSDAKSRIGLTVNKASSSPAFAGTATAGTVDKPSAETQEKPQIRAVKRDRLQTLDGPGQLLCRNSNIAEFVFFAVLIFAILYLSILATLSGIPAAWFLPVSIVAMVSVISFAVFRPMRTNSDALGVKNRHLAERLEAVEDQTWEIRESEERYRSLAEAFGDLVIHRDLRGKVLFANSAFLQVFGQQFGDEPTKSEQYFQLEPLSQSSPMPQNPGYGNSKAVDINLDTPNGPRWFTWLDVAVCDKNTGLSAIVSVARDITERKEHEAVLEQARKRAESASQAKTRFLATVSHEIRTPLNGILGMADLLKGTGLSATQRSYVDAVETSGKSLFALVEDILDITKIEADRLELQPEPTRIRTFMEELAELLANPAHEKNIEIASYVAPQVPDAVMIDSGRLRQVILNIAGNAIKFTKNGGVIVKISLLSTDQTDCNVRLGFEIRDTGHGLAPADQRRIFKEFEQVDDSRNRSHNGAGLGLAISQRIVGKMGGQIELSSTLGEGSVFSFVLEVPLVADVLEEKQRQLQLEDTAGSVFLIAPDSVESAVIFNLVSDFGGQIQTCNTIGKAISVLASPPSGLRPVETIIVDRRQDFDPTKLVARLRSTATQPINVIVLVSPAKRPSVENLLEAGFDGWLMRPLRASSLINVLLRRNGSSNASRPQILDTVDGTLVDAESLPSLNILLAEDNQINQLLARTLMEHSGHRVLVVGNGRSAIDAFSTSVLDGNDRFDLVLMDLHMPDMDGFEATEIIRQKERELVIPPVPVLIVSADEQYEIRNTTLEVGANGFISKPIDAGQLNKAVKLATTGV